MILINYNITVTFISYSSLFIYYFQEEPHEWGGEGTESILPGLSAQLQKLARAAHRWRVALSKIRDVSILNSNE